MENQIAVAEPEYIEILKEPMALGNVFAQSGMFPDIKTQAQAVVKIMAGKELGLTPFQSLASIYPVNGRLCLSANAMASLIKKNKQYDYSIDNHDEKECTISFYKIKGEEHQPIGISTFTFKDAALAGLANKDNWKNYPKNMLFARALSNGARWYCPDAICGWYTMEEMQDIPSEPIKASVEITAQGEVTNGKG